MPKRHIGINRNNKDVLYGVHSKLDGEFYWAVQSEGEAIDYRVELKNWLDEGETISSVNETAGSLTAAKTVNTTSVDYILEGCGELETTITTSNGAKKVIKLCIVDPCRNSFDDYRSAGGNYSYG
ncbi:MAG: hypothetical protein DHS20C07_19080 [Methyloligella sp.]|jgi:hypothetical protein|nr:MAG: hypothetical protein DHS20C07_19080 [Methyloligella sp.]